ncbi:MAG TPA: galactokinase family protein [Gemmatimonadales bacterium]
MTLDGRLGDVRDAALVEARLAAAMHAPERAAVVRRTLEICAAALGSMGASRDDPACALTVPGRIEVLGKHTDYAGGRSILAAPERGVTMLAVPRGDALVRVHDVACGESVELALDPELAPGGGWANYPTTAVRRLARNFPDARTGADIAFVSDLPIAAGMSSSSAFLVAVFQALAAINGLEATDRWRANIATREELAEYLSSVENGRDFGELRGRLGVGTRGGSEDHTAMLCARPGSLVRYGFAPVRFELGIPMPEGHRFAIASSGVRAEKAGAARERYNRAAGLMSAAAELWRGATGRGDATVGAALDAVPGAADRLRAILAASRDGRYAPEELVARAEQFVAEEREIIPAASDALLCVDLARFGALVDRSQELAERLLGNQIAETVQLARSARELGAPAASAFGAGFGGSVWALVADGEADDFVERWRAGYLARFPEHGGDAQFFTTRAGPPLARVI